MFSIISCFLFSCVRNHTLSITTTPHHAVVLINGFPACYEHPCIQTLEKGVYAIDVRAENYLSESFTIMLDGDKNQDVELESKGGWLSIESEPTQLPISIDGALIGKAPLQRIPMSAGVHIVDIPNACFDTLKESIEVISGKEQSIVLKPNAHMSTIQVALLNDDSREEHGLVYADGVELGSTKQKHVVPLCTQHVMVVSKKGWSQTRINLLQEPQNHIVLQMLPLEEKTVDGLLGFEPPECLSNDAVDQECVQRWFSRVRKRAEERNDHTHHEGCAHE
ncbi:MAG: hypothetical protein CL916_03375 [Deltaproteobacteria bacterium]|nr:hypothetical protein [Deltaproteobacteria bacterium]